MSVEIRKPPVTVALGDGISMTFQHIPAGRFRMGQRGGAADEEPVTEVKASEFWMAETPVTQAQYRAMAAGCLEDLSRIEGNQGIDPSGIKGDLHPVEQVSWDDAMVVGRWLSRSGLLPEGLQAGLPSEAMWEYACRAGTDTEYWNGDGEAALEEVGWFSKNAGGKTHPVGEKERPNPWGLHDTHGNVGEWCLDLFDAERFSHLLPGKEAAAHMDKTDLKRAPADPDHIAWAGIFTRIKAGQSELGSEELSSLGRLFEVLKVLVENGEFSWQAPVDVIDRALLARVWAEEDLGLAENLRAAFQGFVDAAEGVGEPLRVVRGGSCLNSAWHCRSAIRVRVRPGDRGSRVGFRLCLSSGPVETSQPEPEAETEAESAGGGKPRRDDESVPELADGADLSRASLPPRSGKEFPEES